MALSIVGFEVFCSRHLVGAKAAVRSGQRIFVSPAMYDLLSHAETEAELLFLVSHIPLHQIPKLPYVLRLDYMLQRLSNLF